jgi:phage tail-like protein
MRGATVDLVSPHPIGETLPALYVDDSFTQRFCDALDGLIAPVVSVLDNMPAYLDLSTAPSDMLPWLAHWVGLAVDPSQRSRRQRELLRSAIDLQGWLGTRHGIEAAIEALFGVQARVEDSGRAEWSVDASQELPGDAAPEMVIRIAVSGGSVPDRYRLEDVIEAIKPAHVAHRVEFAGQA